MRKLTFTEKWIVAIAGTIALALIDAAVLVVIRVILVTRISLV